MKKYNDYELCYLIKENNDDALNIMISKYKPLINKYASKYIKYSKEASLEYEDLIQEGYIGLYKAINNYKDDKYLFYTYANHLISGNMFNAIKKQYNNKNKALNYYVSLDEEVNDLKLIDILKSDVNVESNLLNEELYNNLKHIMLDLDFEQANILQLKISGFKSKEIATLLNINSKRVDNVYYNLKKKLSIKTLNK